MKLIVCMHTQDLMNSYFSEVVLEKMQYSFVFVTIVFLSAFDSGVRASLSCEKCDIKEELIEATKKLNDCEKKLSDNSYLGQVCSKVGNWLSKDTSLKKAVSDLLNKLNVDTDSKNSVERELVIKLTPEDLKTLMLFVADNVGNEQAENILSKSIVVKETLLDKTSEFLSSSIIETSLHFKANYVIIFQVLILTFCVILPLGLGAPKIPVFLFMCLYSVFTTWAKMYYTAAAKKQAILAKHTYIPQTCHIASQGWLPAIGDFVSGLFNGHKDPCEDYYTAAMVDPALEVGLVAAIMETFSSCLVIPAQTLGLTIGSFYHNILEPLPWVWKAPGLILATVLILFILLLSCGYEFSIPFILRIGPDRRKRKNSDEPKQEPLENSTKYSGSCLSGGLGWRPGIVDRHPSEEYDMTDRGRSLPYPLNGNSILDKIVDNST